MKEYVRRSSALGWILCALGMAFVPSSAHAHVGVGHMSGFSHGFAHPLTGLDHVAAMVAVGLWAAQRDRRALWAVPLTFVSVMAVGGLLGAVGVFIPFVEPGIVASVLVLGVLIAAAARLPLVANSLLVGLFAIFHGHAHGAEMPEAAAGLAYGIGFVLGTASLHVDGIGLCLLARRWAIPHAVRYAGGVVTAFGLYFCIA